ncbi:uncharacterized protein LOC135939963 [Cloeon dipterum]|uniref:uncharacterized protein LOC135939963 n=1 Tax=Cloeon dipterum TaxID=197152 RepID=UPI00321FBB3E
MHPGKKVLVLVVLSGLCFAVAFGAAAGKKNKAAAPKTNVEQEKPKNRTVNALRNSSSEPKKAAVGIAQKSGGVKASDGRKGVQQRVSTPRKRTTPRRRRRRTTTPVYDANYDDTYPQIPLRNRNRNKKLPPGMMVVFAPMPPRKPIKRPIFLNKLSTRTTPEWNPSPEQPFWPGSEQWNQTVSPYNYTIDYYQFWTTYYPNYNWSTFYQHDYNNYTTENYYYSTANYYYNYSQYNQEYSPGFSPSYENVQNYTSWPQFYYQTNFTTVFPNYNWSAVYGNYSTYQSNDWSTFSFGNYSNYGNYTTMSYF